MSFLQVKIDSDRLQLANGLSLEQLTIVENESHTQALILDSANNNSVIASVENIHTNSILYDNTLNEIILFHVLASLREI